MKCKRSSFAQFTLHIDIAFVHLQDFLDIMQPKAKPLDVVNIA